jgi:RNA-splicing ligase RtcB
MMKRESLMFLSILNSKIDNMPKKINDFLWEVGKEENSAMNVPIHIYANEKIMQTMGKDRTVRQAANAASLPSIVKHMLVMPDGHEGYGFPVGGVAAFNAEDGIISPGAVGYDINCLHPDTEILSSFGNSVKIKNIDKKFNTISFDYKSDSIITTQPLLFLKKKQKGTILRINTKSGKEISVTKDHPILTKNGMILSKYLNVGSTTVATNFEDLKSGLFYDTIEEIEEISYNGYVYDLTINDPNHNFIANGIVVSNCGVRLIKTNLSVKEVRPKLSKLMDALMKNVPSGVGSKINLQFTQKDLEKVATEGVKHVVDKGFGFNDDIDHIEEYGTIKGADFGEVSPLAKKRGLNQMGTLGAGNHFVEVQRIGEIFNAKIAKGFGLEKDDVTILIHSGSRGFGHQICSDYLRTFSEYQQKNKINLPDPELSYAFVNSKEADSYLGAMRCAVNFAFTNRQVMTNSIRKAFEEIFGKSADALGMDLLYDVAHNIAKLEEHVVDGKRMKLYVHRKGATRAFGPDRDDIPKEYRTLGQPVLIPGSMGSASYVLAGRSEAMTETFGSSCHGSGRLMSRHQAIREIPASKTLGDMKSKGIELRVRDKKLISEEAEWAYKSVDDVVQSIEGAKISNIVAKLIPLGVTKG